MKKEIINVYGLVCVVIILFCGSCSQNYNFNKSNDVQPEESRTVQVFWPEIEGEKFICPYKWRSNARHEKTGYISSPGKSYTAYFSPNESGTYGIKVRYSNDNIDNLSTEKLHIEVNNKEFVVIDTEDTGNYSYGWNYFKTAEPEETISLVADEVYELKAYLLSGDGYGIELDYIDFYKIPTISTTLEGETFIDPDMERSSASKKLTGLIEEPGQVYSTRFFVETAGDYKVSIVYSNDNNGATEKVAMKVNNTSLNEFNALDTGDNGHGWNIFKTHVYSEIISFNITQINTIDLSYTNGDGYGIEIDRIVITPYVPPVIIGERMVAANHVSNPPSVLPYFNWSDSEYHAGVHPGDAGAWSHSGDFVKLDFTVNKPGYYIMTLSLEYSGPSQPSEDLIINIDGRRVKYISDNNSINGYTTISFPVGTLSSGRRIIEFIGPNNRQSVHIPWYQLELQ